MAHASASIDIPASPDLVWQLIGGFNSLPDWLPYIPSSELSDGGRIRRLVNPDGDAIVERLIAFDEDARSYTYSILEAPFPVTGYRATLRVQASGEPFTSKVSWSGEFTPNGVSDAQASSLFTSIYKDGLAALAESLRVKSQQAC
jgi:hypothetical protein